MRTINQTVPMLPVNQISIKKKRLSNQLVSWVMPMKKMINLVKERESFIKTKKQSIMRIVMTVQRIKMKMIILRAPANITILKRRC